MLILLIIFSLFYVFFVGYFALGQIRLFHNYRQEYPADDPEFNEPVSVVVSLHNEENNVEQIFRLINSQKYPTDRIELILVNDASTDRTMERINWEEAKCALNVKIIDSEREPGIAPKKLAISRGIKQASHEIIILIDADISADEYWLRSMVIRMNETGADLMPGVVMIDHHAWVHPFSRVQAVDFAGLLACGLGAAGWKQPFLCNGANLALRKSAFEDIEGYKGYEHILSGDDVFLLEKMRLNKKKINYNLLEESRVLTRPKTRVISFLLQRSRWASKNLKYHSPLLLAALIMSYLYFIVIPLSVLLLPFTLSFPALIVKLVMDFLLIRPFLQRFDEDGDLLKTVLSAELFQFFYIPLAGIMSLLKKVDWE